MLKLFLFGSWQKPGSFQHILREKEIPGLRDSLNVCVCVHHGFFILSVSCRHPSPCVQREFLMLLHIEVVFRTDNPITLIFCPWGN